MQPVSVETDAKEERNDQALNFFKFVVFVWRKRSCEIPLSTTLLMTLSQCNAELISADKEHHFTIKVVKY